MKKIYLILFILSVLMYPGITNAGTLSEGCSAYTCPEGLDYYWQGGTGDCYVEINSASECITPVTVPDNHHRSFSCGAGCSTAPDSKKDWVYDYSTENLVYNDGDIGIGISSPVDELHIHAAGGETYSPWIRLTNDNVGGTLGDGARMGIQGTGDFEIRQYETGKNILLLGGNVGIGTDSPETKFHIKDSGNVYTRIENNTGNQSAVQFADSSDVGEWVVGIHGGDANKFKIAKSTVLQTNTALTIDENLNVGIGTDSPAQKLHIYDSNSVGTPRWDSYLTVESSGQVAMQLLGGNGYSSILFGSSSNDGQIGYSSQLPTQFDFTVGDEVVMVITDGYVSPFAANANQSFNLGSFTRAWENIYMDGYLYDADDTSYYVNPNSITKLQTLYVDGRMYDTDNASYYVNPGATNILDSLTVNSFTNTSDIRLKENVKDLEYGLSEIMKLRPVSFNWKDKEADNVIGLIAQEVQSIVDEVVRFNEDDENKMLGIAYTELIPVLISAIQEQQLIIDELTLRVEEFEK